MDKIDIKELQDIGKGLHELCIDDDLFSEKLWELRQRLHWIKTKYKYRFK